MIKPTFNFFTTAFWDWYIHRIIRSDFREHTPEGGGKVAPDRSVLLLANHFSWWDGFFVYDLNRRLFGKRFHVMMLEEQLRKNRVLRGAGAFSIDRSSGRKSLESLQYAAQLLEDPGNLVLMFPQGRIESAFRQEITFQKGVDRIIRQLSVPPQIVFCINLPDYHSHRKPTLRSYLHLYEGDPELPSLRAAFLSFHQECLAKQASIHA